jgi:hypothetical protein
MERNIKELTEHEFVEACRKLVDALESYTNNIKSAAVEDRQLRIYLDIDLNYNQKKEMYNLVRTFIHEENIRLHPDQIIFITDSQEVD